MIALSGTAQNPIGYTKGDHQCLLKTLAKSYNVHIGDNIEELIGFMKKISEKDLIKFSTEIYKQSGGSGNPAWWPIIEGETLSITD